MTLENKNISEKLHGQLIQTGHILHRVHYINRTSHEKDHIPRSQAHLLKILLENEGVSNKDIVELLDIRPSSAGELVKKLEKEEYIKREINPEDKRVSNIFLTEKGRTTAEIISTARNEKIEKIFKGLTKEEEEQLSELLEKLVNSLKDEFKNYDLNKRTHHHGHRHHHPHDRRRKFHNDSRENFFNRDGIDFSNEPEERSPKEK